ncbi:MAG TPA: hypothetical protein VF360_02200 [Candidatus Methanoperedens sp.]
MCTENQVKRIIHNWTGKSYPKYCQEFFTFWSLLNLYYSTINPNLTGDKKLVLKFGADKNQLLWTFVKDNAKKLVISECVGYGDGPSKPEDEVLNATLYLRDILGIQQTQVCNSCRKATGCSKTYSTSRKSGIELEALMRIVYQIRNNLFHGDKFALIMDDGSHVGSDLYQAERNKDLICISNNILKDIHANLIR